MTKEVTEEITIYDHCAGTLVEYRWIYTDYTGRQLAEPYLGMRIEGSDWVDTKRVVRIVAAHPDE